MTKKMLRIVAFCLVVGMLFAGCSGAPSVQWDPMDGVTLPADNGKVNGPRETQPTEPVDVLTGVLGDILGEDGSHGGVLDDVSSGGIKKLLTGAKVTKFSEMEYIRPDMDAFEQLVLESCRIAETETDADQVMDTVYSFYDAYDRFYTDYFLADIHYNCDLTDTYWEQEYNYCLENASVVDAGIEELFYALAKSPIREELETDEYFGEGYFDYYDGESVWDEEYLALLEQEAKLQSEYYELFAQAGDVEYYSDAYFSKYGTQMAELLVELIAVRQKIAARAGYDSYPEYAYDYYHARDYTPAEAEAYLEQVGEQLADIYWDVNQSDVWYNAYAYCSQEDTFAYVKTAAENMGGNVKKAFSCLEEGGLYDISYSANKMDGAYEVYLWSYQEPFIFMAPYEDQSDKLTFVHEFGHFANDYVCRGSMAGTDVAEVHSQAMEYLSLLYGEDTEDLKAYKMADSLCTYVEQAAYALFEQRAYELEGDELTVENVTALYKQICTDFGFESWNWDYRDFVIINHFYTNPMYIVSYVVSNDVAFQIYQLELEEDGAGLEVYQQCLESMETYLIYFTECYGLESPFADGRLEDVDQILETELAEYLD